MRRTRIASGSDEGSILLAVLASVMVLGMAIVLTATAASGQKKVRHDRDFTSAIQAADAGLNQALFRLTASRNAVSPVAGNGNFGPSSFSWTATRLSGREWRIESAGTREGVTRRIVTNVLEERRFFASAFAHQYVRFNGNNLADSYDSRANRTPGPGRFGLVGSNGPLTFLGNSSTVDGVQLWSWQNGTLATRCSGNATVGLEPALAVCSELAATRPVAEEPYQQRFPETRVYSPSVEDLGERVAPARCGTGPFPDLTINNAAQSVLQPYTGSGQTTGNSLRAVAPSGTQPGYYCYNNITVRVDTTLHSSASRDNPVVIYATGNVTFEGNGRRVNCPTCVTNRDSAPDAAALQIYLTGATSTLATSPQAKFSMALYGPRATCGGGAGNEFYGSLICGAIDNVGGWAFHYDEALESLGNAQFRVTRYQER